MPAWSIILLHGLWSVLESLEVEWFRNSLAVSCAKLCDVLSLVFSLFSSFPFVD